MSRNKKSLRLREAAGKDLCAKKFSHVEFLKKKTHGKLYGQGMHPRGVQTSSLFLKKNDLVLFSESGKTLQPGIYSSKDSFIAISSSEDSFIAISEEAQDRLGVTPNYEVVREWGPDHDKHFVVGIYIGDELIAEGEGPSKQAGQEEAARNALRAKGWV